MFVKLRNNKVFKIVYGVIKTVFFAIIILYLLFIVLQRITNNASIFGYRVFNIASASMEPVYNVGEVILTKEVDPSSLKVGDDITYLGEKGDFNGKIITHRIVEIDEKAADGSKLFTVKGLNNSQEDPVVEEDQVYGKAVYKLKLISLINKLVRNKYGFFFLVFVPLVLVVFLEIADTVVEFKQERKRKKESMSEDGEE